MDKIIDKWDQALNENKELITLGDLNIDILSWDLPNNEMDPYNTSKKKMANLLKEKIIQKGSKILNSKPTRHEENPQKKPTCLDLMISNKPEKITYQNSEPGFSDHFIQILKRKMNEIKKQPKILKIRTYKNFSNQRYRDKIKNHHLYIQTLYEQEPEIITKNIQEIICESLDSEAPQKVIKITQKKRFKIIRGSQNKNGTKGYCLRRIQRQ